MFGAAACVGAVLLVGLLLRLLPSPYPPPPTEQKDPLHRTHEILKRSDRSYALRLESLRQLRESKLASGTAGGVEDEVLTAAAKLLAEHGDTNAAAVALRRLTLLAPRVTKACGKAGIILGPNVSPQLIEARLTNPDDRREVGALIAEYQFAELVRSLVTTHTGAREPAALTNGEDTKSKQ